MANARALLIFGPTDTGLTIGGLTFNFIKTIDDGTVVADTDSTLVELGLGYYTLMNPNITEDTLFSVYPTGQATKVREGIFSLYTEARLADVAHGGAAATFETVDGDLGALGVSAGKVSTAAPLIGMHNWTYGTLTVAFTGTIGADAKIWLAGYDIVWSGASKMWAPNGNSVQLGYLAVGGWVYDEWTSGNLIKDAIEVYMEGATTGITAGTLTITVTADDDTVFTYKAFLPTITATNTLSGYVSELGGLRWSQDAARPFSSISQSPVVSAPSAQEVRDALKLAPSAGAAAAGSVDALIGAIVEDTGTTLPATISAATLPIRQFLVKDYYECGSWKGADSDVLTVTFSGVITTEGYIKLVAWPTYSGGTTPILLGSLDNTNTWTKNPGWTTYLNEHTLGLQLDGIGFPGTLTITVKAGGSYIGYSGEPRPPINISIPYVSVGLGNEFFPTNTGQLHMYGTVSAVAPTPVILADGAHGGVNTTISTSNGELGAQSATIISGITTLGQKSDAVAVYFMERCISAENWDGSQSSPVAITFTGTGTGEVCFCEWATASGSGATLFYYDFGTQAISLDGTFDNGPWTANGVLALDDSSGAVITVPGTLTLSVKDANGLTRTYSWALGTIANWGTTLLLKDGTTMLVDGGSMTQAIITDTSSVY